MGIGVGQLEDGGKAVIPLQRELGSTKAQQDPVPLLCGEKSTTPFPSSQWENPCLPWKAPGPYREGSRSRRVRPCIPHGQSLFPSPAHSASAEFDSGFSIFCSPFTMLVALGAPSSAEAADGLGKKAFLGWKQPELAVGSWDSTEGQPPPSLRAQKLPPSCWQRLPCQRSRRL